MANQRPIPEAHAVAASPAGDSHATHRDTLSQRRQLERPFGWDPSRLPISSRREGLAVAVIRRPQEPSTLDPEHRQPVVLRLETDACAVYVGSMRISGTDVSRPQMAPPSSTASPVLMKGAEIREDVPRTEHIEMTETPNDPQVDDSEEGREKYRVAGDRVISTIKELIHEGNVRHVVIKNDEGRILIEFPVSIGVAGAVLLPVWAAVGAVAAIVSQCTIEIEREPEAEDAVE